MAIRSLLLALGLLATAASGSHAAEAAAYPLTTCLVTGEKLGTMGAPYTFTYEGTEVQLCCKHCKAAFEKDPAKYMKAYESAAKRASE